MRLVTSRTLTVSLLALGLPSLALAHSGIGHGFMQGVTHPVGGMDHLLAMIAVGLLAGRAGKAALWQIPASFVVMMACGTLLGMAAMPLPFVEAGIALSIVAFGLMLAASRSPTVLLGSLAVGFFALFHGHAHGSEAAGDVSGLAYSAGLLAMSALLHAGGAGVAVGMMRMQQSLVLRFGGGVLAVVGSGMLAALI